MTSPYRRIASLKTADDFRQYTQALGIDLPLDDMLAHGSDAPLAQRCEVHGRRIGNRFCILPMEGWDSTGEGGPGELTVRRWRRFGASGAKLIWGGEAVSVREDGRDSPGEMVLNEQTLPAIAKLRETLEAEHRRHFGTTDDLLVGLQLTHSGRFSRPYDKFCSEPVILYHHPILDRKFPLPMGHRLLSDHEVEKMVEDFVQAAVLAQCAGLAFVDIKHCHGYMGQEFLSALPPPGGFGGSLENRPRYLS